MQPRFDDGVLAVDWPAPPQVRAVCSTREGGASRAPYDSLNLGDHVGDEPQAVAANRTDWARRLGVRPVFLQQVHGTAVVPLSAATPDGTVADACLATEPGVACTIMVADCLPVLLCDTRGTQVAAAHAGWRSLAGHPPVAAGAVGTPCGAGPGVLEVLARRFEAAHTLAWLGPCIGPGHFEVGPEVKAAFEAHDPECADLFIANDRGRWMADLPGLARRRLKALGITRIFGNDGGTGWCTVANASRFFSHRRDRVSGRLAASVWLRA